MKPVAGKCSSLYFVCKGCDNNEEVLEVVCNPNEQPEVSEIIVTESTALGRMIIGKLQGSENRLDQSFLRNLKKTTKTLMRK